VIEFNCEHCGEELAYPDSLGGTDEACPACKKSLTVPVAFYDDDDDDLDDLSLDSVSDTEAINLDLGDTAPPPRQADDDAIDLEPEDENNDAPKKIIHSGAGSSWAQQRTDPDASEANSDDAIDLEDHGGPRKAIIVEDHQVTQQAKKMLGPDVPTMIMKNNLYLIVDHKEMVAYHTGEAWAIHVKDGYVSARMNEKIIPSNGQFILVVVVVGQDDQGHNRLSDIQSYQLRERFALKALAADDDAIFETITAKAELEDKQKKIVRKRIDAKFLPHIWDGAEDLL